MRRLRGFCGFSRTSGSRSATPSILRNRPSAMPWRVPERLQLVMQLYFVEELNLAEIAATLDVSVPRVHQLKAQALERLRAALGGQVDIV